MAAMDITIRHAQLHNELIACFKNNLVPYITSSPGIGKSDSAKQFAGKYNLQVIDLRLSQCTPEDLQGFPMRNGNKATFTPFDFFPLEGEELPDTPDGSKNEDGTPKKMNGWLLLLDELSSATKAVQAAAYKLILDRQVGSFNLHDKVMIMACGNNITDKAVVHKMSTALQSRLIHYKLGLNVKDWVQWATREGVDYRIIAFIQFNQKMFMNFNPEHTDSTYACPRTWEFLNRLINGENVDRANSLARVVGTVGQEAGYEFLTFCEVQKDLPKWEDIMDPIKNQGIPVPVEASAKFATICWLAGKATKAEAVKAIPFVKRFGADFQVIYCRGIITRYSNIDRESKEFGEYAMNMITELDRS